MIPIKYFLKNDVMCGSDFDNAEYIDYINPKFIVSISQLIEFSLPFSLRSLGYYSVVSMSNGDKYYIKEESHINLHAKFPQP